MKADDIVFYAMLALVVPFMIVNRILSGFGNIMWIADFATIFGIAYLFFVTRGNKIYFLCHIVSCIFLGIVNLTQHIYFAVFYYLAFCIPFYITGFLLSSRRRGEIRPKQLSRKGYLISAIVMAIAIPAVYFILKELGGNYVLFDTLSFSLCMLGVTLGAFLFIDQFYVFQIGNVFLIILHVLMTIDNINAISLLALDLFFVVGGFLSIVSWNRLIKKQKAEYDAKK